MAKNNRLSPDYIFETSWEVCNKVGGIYTVLSTKAKTLQETHKDKVIFIGPELDEAAGNPDFIEDNNLLKEWKEFAFESENLKIRIGRWDIPGKPITILVNYHPYFANKNDIYFRMWDQFGVKSMNAYGDYDESCIFAYATGRVIENFYRFYQLKDSNVVAHFNEWMLGMGALYLKAELPAVATVFTTHATSIGRSIAGNNKPLYTYLDAYNGDQMAEELNMEAKHSIEKQTAWNVDCFTTVSDITSHECARLLDKAPDIVTPNGFENNFVAKGKTYDRKRKEARNRLLYVAEQLTGEIFPTDALMIATSGRYEYKNKGIDVFIEAINRIRNSQDNDKTILSFILVPAWQKGARTDLQLRLQNPDSSGTPLFQPFTTHELYDSQNDKICEYLKYLDFHNQYPDKVKLIFVPSYLTGKDGIFDLPYYDVLIGMDMTVFPSYYEPWGYTPLESIAFGIPTITTDLAGFGIWSELEGASESLCEGVEVLKRTDDNYFEVAEKIKEMILSYSRFSGEDVLKTRKAAVALSEKASWNHFIEYYYEAYSIALKKAALRKSKKRKEKVISYI